MKSTSSVPYFTGFGSGTSSNSLPQVSAMASSDSEQQQHGHQHQHQHHPQQQQLQSQQAPPSTQSSSTKYNSILPLPLPLPLTTASQSQYYPNIAGAGGARTTTSPTTSATTAAIPANVAIESTHRTSLTDSDLMLSQMLNNPAVKTENLDRQNHHHLHLHLNPQLQHQQTNFQRDQHHEISVLNDSPSYLNSRSFTVNSNNSTTITNHNNSHHSNNSNINFNNNNNNNNTNIMSGNQQQQSDNKQSVNNTSSSGPNDFVRKLFSMLEEPEYRDVVTWTKSGDSFVVIDTNEFTRTILPRHFKHSNFASFVRQLNKYDFHKIRANAGDTSSLYGDNAWEFKHPDFQLHNKDQIDNIKRKTVNSRKQQQSQAQENSAAAPAISSSTTLPQQQQPHQQQDLLNSPITAAGGVAAAEHVSRLESELNAMRVAQNELTRELRALRDQHATTIHRLTTLQQVHKISDDVLRQLIVLETANRRNESNYAQFLNLLTTLNTTESTRNESSIVLPAQRMIQPTYTSSANELQSNQIQSLPPLSDHKRSASTNKLSYLVLLVEDDDRSVKVCRKFLTQYGCEVDVANDGVSAVKRAQCSTYDIILMETVIPQLDGLSATELIRKFDTGTPIVAMTSNVTTSDVDKYYRHGMTDILPKPFTRDDLVQLLDLHLKGSDADGVAETLDTNKQTNAYGAINSATTPAGGNGTGAGAGVVSGANTSTNNNTGSYILPPPSSAFQQGNEHPLPSVSELGQSTMDASTGGLYQSKRPEDDTNSQLNNGMKKPRLF